MRHWTSGFHKPWSYLIHPRASNTIHFHLDISRFLHDLSILLKKSSCHDLMPNPLINPYSLFHLPPRCPVGSYWLQLEVRDLIRQRSKLFKGCCAIEYYQYHLKLEPPRPTRCKPHALNLNELATIGTHWSLNTSLELQSSRLALQLICGISAERPAPVNVGCKCRIREPTYSFVTQGNLLIATSIVFAFTIAFEENFRFIYDIFTLLSNMFHAPMGRFQLELINFCYLFFHRRPIR